MMMSVCESRSNKRKFDEVDGSESDGWTMQQKCFVNQRLVNINDEQKMVKIHQKTLQLLFEGVKNMSDKFLSYNKILRLSGNGQIRVLQGYEHIKLPEEAENMCRNCNDYSRISGACANCPRELCELCGISCETCDEFLCKTCVQFFGCNINNEIPCCDKCKAFS